MIVHLSLSCTVFRYYCGQFSSYNANAFAQKIRTKLFWGTYHLSELDRWVSYKGTVSVLLWKDDFFDNKLGRIEAMHLLSGSPVLTNDNHLRMAKDDYLDVEG